MLQGRIQKGSGGFGTDYFILWGYSRKVRDHLQIDPPPSSLIYLNPLSWSRFVDPPLNIKAYGNYSGFTGKPVKAEGVNDPRVSVSENLV